jgi:hypothetical protein
MSFCPLIPAFLTILTGEEAYHIIFPATIVGKMWLFIVKMNYSAEYILNLNYEWLVLSLEKKTKRK